MKLTELELTTLLSSLKIAEASYLREIQSTIQDRDRLSHETFQRHLKRTQELHSLLLNADYIEVIAL